MDVVALRKSALAALGAFGDHRARRALEIGALSLAPIARRWGGSEGEIVAHVACLGLDAATLGALRGSPDAEIETTAALAAALAETPGHTLDALRAYWAFEERAAGAYRGVVRVDVDRRDDAAVLAAARAFLAAKGAPEAAATLVSVAVEGGDGVFRALARLTLCEHHVVTAVEACLEDLLHGIEGDAVYARCAP